MGDKSYLMRKSEERCYQRYLFTVDSLGRVSRVELIPNIGEHSVYERGNKELKEWNRTHVVEPAPKFSGTPEERDRKLMNFLASDENRERGHWKTSEPILMDRLSVKDPIVRDAFGEGVNADQLFMNYRLVLDSGRSY